MKRQSWAVFALYILEFHERQQKEFGISISGRPAGTKDGWSIRNTAQAQGISLGRCHNLITVAKALKKDPVLGDAPSFNAAIKLAKLS